jgi:hypothetical protein
LIDAMNSAPPPPPDKDKDAELARNVAILRARQSAEVDRLKQSLAAWIEGNTQLANDVAVSIAMLETAFDRYIDLHGATDAFELIESAFRRRAEKFRRSLQ